MTIKVILTDIEGTTTDIRFVHNVLFPYARQALPEFVKGHWDDAAVQSIMAEARLVLDAPDADQTTLIQAFINWIDQDKKVTALKTLQGLIWVQGYKSGDFTGHLYEDAYEYLKRWSEQGVELSVFSSGSVKAQQLLFGYSDFGDLTSLFSHYFDTSTGHKRETAAYVSIANALQQRPENILFLSDIVEELDAAQSAGMKTCLLAREELPENATHNVVSSFESISV
ncbi:acireductone synthase [Neptunomonas japonica]|uniref:acireductone synthase n=1 Tax=Neptunomonas japonica TaxID=417574 RepID=UPI0004146591|nr:acireductone synthase [Neptunomonas japonica]